MSESIDSIVVIGDGLAAHLTTLALAQLLPSDIEILASLSQIYSSRHGRLFHSGQNLKTGGLSAAVGHRALIAPFPFTTALAFTIMPIFTAAEKTSGHSTLSSCLLRPRTKVFSPIRLREKTSR